MDEIPKPIIDSFKKVREDSGVSISQQMKMYENGYRIVRSNKPFFGEDLNCKKYEVLEYTEDDEWPIVGNVMLKSGEFCSAEIINNMVFNEHDINMVRMFLDEVYRFIRDKEKQ